MKQLTCEMCGETDLLKHDGVFICQSCGTKYSVEEAKKMMIEGTVEVTGTVKIDNTDSINNYLDVANSALLSGNGNEAFNYANKALEVNPKHSEAWIIKMKSIGHLGTVGNTRSEEAVSYGEYAIEFAPTEKRYEIEKDVFGYFLRRSLELLQVATSRMLDMQDIANTFQTLSLVNAFTAAQETMEIDSATKSLLAGLVIDAMFYKTSVPVEIVKDTDDFQDIVKAIADEHRKFTNAYDKRSKIYGAELTSSARKAHEDMQRQFKEGILTYEERNIKRKERENEKFKFSEKYLHDNPELQKIVTDKKSLIEGYSSRVHILKSETGIIRDQIFEETKNINAKKRRIRELEESITRNKKKIFGKEKALLAVQNEEDEISTLQSEVLNSETTVSSLENEIKPKQDELTTLKDKLKTEEKQIDDIYLTIYEQMK